MKIWIVSMECAGIAEAGGVKNVSFSLCKELALLGHKVTLFIPVYKCTSYELIKKLKKDGGGTIQINQCGKQEQISYSTAVCTQGDFDVVFVNHQSFAEKEGVYTYTAAEQEKNPDFVKGFGHKDTLFMDSLFSKAVCAYSSCIKESEIPDIIHCQDASTALVPSFAIKNKDFEKTATVVTIHNAGPAYHHNFSSIGEAAWITGLPETERLPFHIEILGPEHEPRGDRKNEEHQYFERLIADDEADICAGIGAGQGAHHREDGHPEIDVPFQRESDRRHGRAHAGAHLIGADRKVRRQADQHVARQRDQAAAARDGVHDARHKNGREDRPVLDDYVLYEIHTDECSHCHFSLCSSYWICFLL